MMRKNFPISVMEASRRWSPPPAPLQFQNNVNDSTREHDKYSNFPRSSLDQESYSSSVEDKNIGTFDADSTTDIPPPSDVFARKDHNEGNIPTSSINRHSFGSIFTQLRRLPRKTLSHSSIISSDKGTTPNLAVREDLNFLNNISIPPSTLTTHQRDKNLHLLRSWTDEGHYSRVKAMTIASILYNRKVTEGDIRAELTPKEKFAYKKFCLEIEDKLEMITSREPTRRREPFSERTLRKIWHLYALYSKALSDEIWDEGSAKSDITSRAIAHLVKRAVAGGPMDNINNNCSNTTTHSSTSTPTLKPVDPLDSVNPVLASSLKDPIQAFLIVYGRYVSTGKVNQVERLRKLVHFNEIAKEFFQKLVEPPENVDVDTYLLLLRQHQQQYQQKRNSGFTGYGGRSSISMPFSTSYSQTYAQLRSSSHHHKRKNKNKLSSGSSNSFLNDGVDTNVSNDSQDSLIKRDHDDMRGRGCSCPPAPPVCPCAPPVDIPPPTDNDVKSLQRKIQMLDGKKRICLAGCRYEVLPQVALSTGFEIVGENDLWNINWSDTPLAQEKIMQMRRVQDMYSVFWGLNAPLQKCNHFPGMYEICRKDRLGRNLNRLKRLFPGEYNFFPETFDLPTEQSDLIAYARRRKKNNMTFIIKPESGCQGKGIFLLRNLKKLSPFAKCVCQLYIPHPFLIDGYKFDQRIYVLITCVDPLRLYIYDEGIGRFATVKYEVPTEENLEVVYMHLTNYSLNKFSESYVREGDGSKRTLSSIYYWMAENGYDVPKLIRSIDEIVVKTLLCAHSTLKHNYKTSFPKRDRGCSCFELLGFDILIDRHLNPILLEVNHSPSFNLDLPVDHQVKTALLKDMLNMVYLGEELNQLPNPALHVAAQKNSKKKNASKKKPKNRKSSTGAVAEEVENQEGLSEALQKQFKHEMKNRGLFRLIYSSDKPGRFQKLCMDDYCGYNVMTTVTPHERQMVLFDRDPDNSDDHKEQWKPPKTCSTVKVTKRGQKYVETRVINPDFIGSSQHVQKFREIQERSRERSRNPGHPQQQEAKRSRSRISNGNSLSVASNIRASRHDGGDVEKREHRKRRKSCRPSAAKVVMCSEDVINSNNSNNNNHNKEVHHQR